MTESTLQSLIEQLDDQAVACESCYKVRNLLDLSRPCGVWVRACELAGCRASVF